MDMPGPSASSEKSLEEQLYQWWVEETMRKKLTAQGAASEPASMFFSSENAKRGDEASPGFHHERGNTPRGSNEKMGPRPGQISKTHRQHRQTMKGPIKVYPADPSNFKHLVHEYTSMHASSLTLDVAAQPTSPLTPQSTSNSSAWGFVSQPSSPATPHSIQSSSTSPLSSPNNGVSLHLNPFQLAHTAEYNPFNNTYLSFPYTPPPSQIPTLDQNTNLHQSPSVPRCASTPCLGNSSEVENVPSDNGWPHGMSPEFYASLERYLFS